MLTALDPNGFDITSVTLAPTSTVPGSLGQLGDLRDHFSLTRFVPYVAWAAVGLAVVFLLAMVLIMVVATRMRKKAYA